MVDNNEELQCKKCIWHREEYDSCETPYEMPSCIMGKCPYLTTVEDAKKMLRKVIEATQI